MKFLLASALTALTGLGVFTATSSDEGPCPIADGECTISTDCLPDGSCLITCEGPDETCTFVVECDEPCEPQDCEPQDCEPKGCESAPQEKSACEAASDCAG